MEMLQFATEYGGSKLNEEWTYPENVLKTISMDSIEKALSKLKRERKKIGGIFVDKKTFFKIEINGL